MALVRMSGSIDWRILIFTPLALSLITFLLYRTDKRWAETKAWRVPESTLHLAALLGGWPGAYWGQQWFRHKTAKLSFRLVFWLTIGLHEYFALDYLIGWKLTRRALHFVGSWFA